MSVDTELKKSQTSIPECVAAGYVDMSTGMLLGISTVDSHPQGIIDLVAAATADLFQGGTVVAIEKMFRKSRGQTEDGVHYFQETLVFSENLLHVFIRSKKYPDHCSVFVCRASVNIGMALTKSRMSATNIEASV